MSVTHLAIHLAPDSSLGRPIVYLKTAPFLQGLHSCLLSVYTRVWLWPKAPHSLQGPSFKAQKLYADAQGSISAGQAAFLPPQPQEKDQFLWLTEWGLVVVGAGVLRPVSRMLPVLGDYLKAVQVGVWKWWLRGWNPTSGPQGRGVLEWTKTLKCGPRGHKSFISSSSKHTWPLGPEVGFSQEKGDWSPPRSGAHLWGSKATAMKKKDSAFGQTFWILCFGPTLREHGGHSLWDQGGVLAQGNFV